MDVTLGWVVGFLGLALTVISILLTVRYGRLHEAWLQRICKGLGLERLDNP
jgi:hypothetical protein